MLKLKLLGVATALVMTTSICFAGCSFGFISHMSYVYDHADNYIAGDREITDDITNINVDYVSGSVTLKGDSTDVVSVTETANKTLTEQQQVHTWVDGNTLYIKYCESSTNINFDGIEKRLEIVIPEDKKLDNLTVDITSGDFVCSSVETDILYADATSGSFDVSAQARDITLDITSGSISLDQNGSCSSISIDSTSGSVNADIEEADSVNIDVTSGTINVTADRLASLVSDGTSGDSEYKFNNVPDRCDISRTSGNITIYLHEDIDLTISPDMTSGEFNSDLPFTKHGDDYIIGDGTSQMRFDTTSGDINIRVW